MSACSRLPDKALARGYHVKPYITEWCSGRTFVFHGEITGCRRAIDRCQGKVEGVGACIRGYRCVIGCAIRTA